MDFDDDDDMQGAIVRLDSHLMALRGLEQLLKLAESVSVPTGHVSVRCVPNLLRVLINDLDRCRDDIERLSQAGSKVRRAA